MILFQWYIADGILRLKMDSKVDSVLHQIEHLLGLSHEQNCKDFNRARPTFTNTDVIKRRGR